MVLDTKMSCGLYRESPKQEGNVTGGVWTLYVFHQYDYAKFNLIVPKLILSFSSHKPLTVSKKLPQSPFHNIRDEISVHDSMDLLK